MWDEHKRWERLTFKQSEATMVKPCGRIMTMVITQKVTEKHKHELRVIVGCFFFFFQFSMQYILSLGFICNSY